MIFLLILSEGFTLGFSGLAPCIPMGSLFCEIPSERGQQHHYQPVRACPRGNTSVELFEILLSLLLTLVVSLIAGYKPAREATQIAPREAMATLGPITMENGRWAASPSGVDHDLLDLACS